MKTIRTAVIEKKYMVSEKQMFPFAYHNLPYSTPNLSHI